MFLLSDDARIHLCNALHALRQPEKLLENHGLIAPNSYVDYDDDVPHPRKPSWEDLERDLADATEKKSEQLRNMCREVLRRRNDTDWFYEHPLDNCPSSRFLDQVAQFEVRLPDDGYKFDGFEILDRDFPTQRFFPAGAQHDAYVELRRIFREAKSEILIVDNYVDETLWQMLTNLAPNMNVRILTQNMKGDFTLEGRKFAAQHQFHIEVKNSSTVHDRLIVVDGMRCWHVGASIKDAGNKAFLISEILAQNFVKTTIDYIEKEWQSATSVTL